ncbi:hypothetical protein EC991_000494 [Linnemannia zychae]|nr:hypothetical protein EC991_000494 [Linnemannia zychae]
MVGLIELPTEIQEQIRSYLTQHDLTTCVCVSKSWSNLFNPHLWHTIDLCSMTEGYDGDSVKMFIPGQSLDFSRFKNWIQSDDGRGRAGLLRNGHLIRKLKTRFCSVFDLVIEADVESRVTGLTDLLYFSDPVLGISWWDEDNAQPGGSESFEACPELFEEEENENEGEGTGLSATILGAGTGTETVQSALVQLLRQNQNLKNLTLLGTINLHQYERSYYNHNDIDVSVVQHWLEALPGSLETLSMDTPWSTSQARRVGGLQHPVFLLPTLNHLHTLNLLCVRYPYSGNYQTPTNLHGDIIRACPNLESLRLPVNVPRASPLDFNEQGSTWSWTPVDFAQIIQECCRQLTALYIDGPSTDDYFAQLLGSSHLGWKSIRISDGRAHPNDTVNGFGQLATEALLKHATTLRNVRLENCNGVTSASIQQLLSTAANLKQFHSIATDNFLKEATLDATDLIQSQWVCSGLESFACKITHIPRPDLTLKGRIEDYQTHRFDDDYGRSAMFADFSNFSLGCSVGESHQLQGQVYNQLAQLCNLQELILDTKRYRFRGRLFGFGPTVIQDDGKEFRDCHQPHALSMSLKSGLDVLKCLRELRLFAFGAMPVSLGRKEEKAWKKKHWPRAVELPKFAYLNDSCWSSLFDPPRDWGSL